MLELDELSRTTYSAVFSDVLDAMGYRNQVLKPVFRPLVSPEVTLIGWARTARSVAVTEPPERHYGTEIDFIDSLRRGDVVVVDGGTPTSALWGELFSTAAIARGARGAVVHGYIRDQGRIPSGRFPVHALGVWPTDSLGRMSISATGEPVEIKGVSVREGDLIVADRDGVIIVPADTAEEAAGRALEKATREGVAREMLREGSYLREAWEKHGVL